MSGSVYGIAEAEDQARRILVALLNSGFPADEISVLFADQSGRRDFVHEKATKAPEGASAGAGAGSAVGGALGLLVGIGALTLPGVGALVAAGPFLAMLSGAAVGAAVGGLTGALVGLGIPEYEARRYAGKVQRGQVLLSVHVAGSEERARAREILEANGAADVGTGGEARPPTT